MSVSESFVWKERIYWGPKSFLSQIVHEPDPQILAIGTILSE